MFLEWSFYYVVHMLEKIRYVDILQRINTHADRPTSKPFDNGKKVVPTQKSRNFEHIRTIVAAKWQ